MCQDDGAPGNMAEPGGPVQGFGEVAKFWTQRRLAVSSDYRITWTCGSVVWVPACA